MPPTHSYRVGTFWVVILIPHLCSTKPLGHATRSSASRMRIHHRPGRLPEGARPRVPGAEHPGGHPGAVHEEGQLLAQALGLPKPRALGERRQSIANGALVLEGLPVAGMIELRE